MQAEKNAKRTATNYRILVVDDSNIHLQLLETWLSESGFTVVAVNDGYAAIDRFNHEHFDLVLTDICMPGLSGNTLARYIQIVRKEVPVVAITASPFLADPDFDLVISKPCELAGLVTSLQYVLHKLSGNLMALNDSKRKLLAQLQGLNYSY